MSSTSSTSVSTTPIKKRLGRPPGSKNKNKQQPVQNSEVAAAFANRYKAQLIRAVREIEELRDQLRNLKDQTDKQSVETESLKTKVSSLQWQAQMDRLRRTVPAPTLEALLRTHPTLAGPPRTEAVRTLAGPPSTTGPANTERVRTVAPVAQMVRPLGLMANESARRVNARLFVEDSEED